MLPLGRLIILITHVDRAGHKGVLDIDDDLICGRLFAQEKGSEVFDERCFTAPSGENHSGTGFLGARAGVLSIGRPLTLRVCSSVWGE